MTTREVDLEGLSVCVGMPAGRDLHPLTVTSLLRTQLICIQHGIPFQAVLVAGSAVIQWARDEVVDLFLETDANRLFWIDSDMIWEPDDFMRLLAISQQNEVVCASYPAKTEPATYFLSYEPDAAIESDNFETLSILGAGLGFTVMHRKVIEELCENAPKLYDEVSEKSSYEIFRVGRNAKGNRQGEDMAFFEDVRKLGYRISLDISIKLGHVGNKIYRGDITKAFELTPKEN